MCNRCERKLMERIRSQEPCCNFRVQAECGLVANRSAFHRCLLCCTRNLQQTLLHVTSTAAPAAAEPSGRRKA